MRTMSNDVLFFANWFLGSSLFVKTWIVSAVAMVSEALARKRSAAVRHIVLATAFGMLLGLPVAPNILPAIRIVVPITASNNTVSQSKDWQPWTVSALEPGGSIGRSTSTTAKTQANLWESRLLPAGWLAVFLLLLIPISSGLWRLRRLRQSAIQWTRGQSLVDSIAAKEGINRHVALVLQPKVSGPMTCGALRPMIFFPEDATAWPKEDLQRALVHELEHVKRGDWAIQCLARIICAGYWFNPFVWVAWRRLVLQAERACDDAVLHDGDAIAYADQLIDTALRVSMISKQPLPAMANRSELAARVHAVLDPRQRRGPVGRRFLLVAFSIAAVLVFVLSTFKIDTTAQSAEPQWQKAAGGRMSFEVASVKEAPVEQFRNGANFPLDAGDSFTQTGGYFKGDFPAFVFIAFAYKLNPPGPEQRNIMLDGVPGWVTTRRFTIEARSSGSPTKDQFRLMMQSLLAERFHLAVHFEPHEIPVYALLRVSPAKLGPKLHRYEDNPPCSPAEFEPTQNPCGNMVMARIASGHNLWQSRNIPMALFADYLVGPVDRLVVDRTGLSGGFDLSLDFLPENLSKSDSQGPLFVDALHEQLGLKLEPAKAAVQILRIDHVEVPSEN